MNPTKKSEHLQQQVDLLDQQFLFVNQLMNCRGPLIVSGGGVLFPIAPDNKNYDRLKAVLSDIGCDIAAEIHSIRYSILSATTKRKTG